MDHIGHGRLAELLLGKAGLAGKGLYIAQVGACLIGHVIGSQHMPDLPLAAVFLYEISADTLRIPHGLAGAVGIAGAFRAQGVPYALGRLAVIRQHHAGGGNMVGDQVAIAKVVPDVLNGSVGRTLFIQRLLESIGILGHIVAGDLVHAHIVAPVGAKGGGCRILVLSDPERFQLLPALVVHLHHLAAGHQILYGFNVPDSDDALIIRINPFLAHLSAS